MSNLKLEPSNLSNYKASCKTKTLKFQIQKYLIWEAIVIFEISVLELNLQQILVEKSKSLHLGPKMSDLSIIGLKFENNIFIFEVHALEFAQLQSFVKKVKIVKWETKNTLFGCLCTNFEKLLYLKPTTCNLSFCKVWCKNKNLLIWGQKCRRIFGLGFEVPSKLSNCKILCKNKNT